MVNAGIPPPPLLLPNAMVLALPCSFSSAVTVTEEAPAAVDGIAVFSGSSAKASEVKPSNPDSSQVSNPVVNQEVKLSL
ncbi:hypothetical protein DA89_2427 [Vibrio paracholerae]|nr:hypothetical protein DA89_2427 [Vibrio paracholerae]